MKTLNEILNKLIENSGHQKAYQERLTYVMSHPKVLEFFRLIETPDEDMISRSQAKLNEFVQEFDRFQSGEMVKSPGLEPYLFINQNFIDVGYRTTQDYNKKIAQQVAAERIDNRMMSRDVRQASLDDIFLTPERTVLFQEIMAFIRNIKVDICQSQGLYLSGAFGIGKTYILGAMANNLAEMGFRVSMVHYPTFIQNIKASLQTSGPEGLINAVKSVDVLILDDIGAESNTAWIRDEILGVILEYRMKEKLPTFFTSNFSMSELQNHLQETKSTTDTIKAARIMERIKFLAKEIRLDGKNLRQAERT